MADGSITFSTALDNGQLEKQLQSLSKRIERTEEKIAQKQAERAPLAEQSKQLAADLDAAKARLEYMKSGQEFFTGAQVKTQTEAIRGMESDWSNVQGRVERYDAAISNATLELERSKEKAGGIAQELSAVNDGASMMAPALESAGKYMDRFTARVKNLARRVLVFSVITAALRQMRTWMGNVMKTNSEASVAVARLKGALLTLAQPLVSVVVPAFTALVNVLTKVVSVIAQLFAMLTGTTIDSTKQAAEALDKETAALNGTGSAAKDAGKQLAGFDEINKLSDNSSSGGGAGSSGVSPDFDFSADMTEGQLKNILGLVEAIGTAFLAWKIGSALGLSLEKTVGLAIAIYAGIQMVKNLFDIWNNGADLGNVLGMMASAAALAAGLYVAFGKTGAGIGLVVSGLAMLVAGIHDVLENGWNFENLLLTIAGILATGIGISLLTGSFIPALIAGIAGLVLAITVAYGHGEELIDGIKKILQGFVDFFCGVFTGDIDRAIQGVCEIVDGLRTVFGAVLGGIRDMFTSFFDWLDEKTGGQFHGIITTINGFITTVFDTVNETLGNIMDAVKTVLTGVIEFLSGVFTGDWDKAWKGVKDIFKGVWNGIVSLLEGAVNLIVRGVNWLITQLNKIHFEIPDWVPGIGGNSFGINIPAVSEVKIPRLATGAVIPPNREFMAILGDQKSGTNIEAPLETIVQAVMLALQKSGTSSSGGGQVIENAVYLDGEVIYRNQKKISKRHGVNLTGR